MGELDLARHVADGEEGGDPGAAIFVRFDEPAFVGLQTGVLEIQAIRDRLATHGAEEQVGFEHFVAEMAAHSRGGGGDLFERFAGEDADAEVLLHAAPHFPAHIRIEQQQNVIEQFDDRHPDAKRCRHACQFAPDESAAENEQGPGQGIDGEEAAAFHHAFVPGQEAGHGRGRTGGDDDLPGAQSGAVAEGDGVAVLE